jgi:hydrogenase maturation protein HypF
VQIEIRGIVQGVGFRPFVYNLAQQHALSGYVLNDTRGVTIEVEGQEPAVNGFLVTLQTHPPPLAHIESVEFRNDLDPLGYSDFSIRPSCSGDETFVLISPDIATCEDCRRELFDATDRRSRYPFINCTNCGPRFTIIRDVPYDREKTTMRVFPMCPACRREYHDPTNRRFHAQPNACPACGPQVHWVAHAENQPDLVAQADNGRNPDAISEALKRIERGEIVAIKGVGGFHLACDALNAEAVATLRKRKYREQKPFALMAGDVASIREFCSVSDEEETLLRSERRPVVLLRKRRDGPIPEAVAPGLKYLGFMLPYTPLHHLLVEGGARPLVMTSGNISDEPIAYRNDEAIERLRSIADGFLLHDREIHTRCDDSVTRLFRGQEYPVRRSRGYVPYPIKLSVEFGKDILACGAELKNTFCLTHKNYAFISHHIGDLENLETLHSFEEGIEQFQRLFYLEPEVAAYDLHPEYLSTKYALALEKNLSLKIGVQHHHAHVASCMADNNLDGEVIGVAMDGLGYGTDGRFWGSEFFIARFHDCERRCHLEYVPMPGGVKAIQEPWRMAAVYLRQAVGEDFLDLDVPFVKRLNTGAWRVLQQMINRRINSPLTCGMGRLFDAVSSLLDLRDTVNYEGEAAIELEMMADESGADSYWFDLGENGSVIQPEPVITSIIHDLTARVPIPVIAAKFHHAVAEVIARVATRIRNQERVKRVVLSGGVFQNMLLLEQTCRRLEAQGLAVYVHHQVPPNDGGIALGQAVVADAQIKAGRI